MRRSLFRFAAVAARRPLAPLRATRWLCSVPKTPMELIAEVPPVEVDGDVAVCYGGEECTVETGHPVQYIQLNRRKPGTVATCKYCGLRYVRKTKVE